MENFQRILEELLKECEALLTHQKAVTSNMLLLNLDEQDVLRMKKETPALSLDDHTWQKVQNLVTYQACRSAFQESVFEDAPRLAGYWGTFERILWDIIHYCGRIRQDSVIFDDQCVRQQLGEHRERLLASKVVFTSDARLLGVRLQCKEIVLVDGLSLYRLNKKQVSEREHATRRHASELQAFQTSSHTTELRMTLTVSVDRNKDNAFFDAESEAHRIAWHSFRNLRDAILLIKSGQIEFSPQRFFGGLIGGITSIGSPPRRIPNLNIIIGKRDTAQIVRAYKLVSGKLKEADKVVSRALHRFLLGRKRMDLTDKFVDYVISWESLLLTQKGSAVTQELRYRFAVNGSSLICKMSRDKDKKKYFKVMRCIYDLRSNIVHGGDDKQLDKILQASGLTNLGEACIFLENNFRVATWWLLSLESHERPYIKEDGWEDLLWS